MPCHQYRTDVLNLQHSRAASRKADSATAPPERMCLRLTKGRLMTWPLGKLGRSGSLSAPNPIEPRAIVPQDFLLRLIADPCQRHELFRGAREGRVPMGEVGGEDPVVVA